MVQGINQAARGVLEPSAGYVHRICQGFPAQPPLANIIQATPSSHDLAPQRTDGPESAPRKIQKTWQGQSLSVSSSKIRGEIAVQGSGSSELTEVDNFLSDLSEELDAKAARKIRFSAYL